MLRKLRRLLQSLVIGLCLFPTTAETGTDAANSDLRPAQDAFGNASVTPCLIGQAYADGSITVDCNTYDLQKLGSMGRQIILGTGNTPDRNLEFVWIHRFSSGIYVTRYDSWLFDLGFFGAGAGGINIGFASTADQYPVITPRADGAAMIAEISSPVFLQYGRTRTFGNTIPGLADFDGGDIPDSVWQAFDNGTPGFDDEFKWPQIAVKITGTTEISHMIIHNSNENNTIGNNFLYTRHIGSTMDFLSDNNWEPARQFGWSGYHSAVIATSQVDSSGRVAIAFSGGRGGGAPVNIGLGANCDNVDRTDGTPSGLIDNDLYVYISDDQGVTWSSCQNLTNRPNADPGGYAPQAKVSILFDDSDVLRVAWQSTYWPGSGGAVGKKSRMYHWDESSGLVRQVVDATWDAPFCTGSVNQLNADNPQLSYCDGKVYLTYTLFAPPYLGKEDDCHTDAFVGSGEGLANGDIYVSVSSTSGLTWDEPRNLTDTYTPDCDTASATANPDCLSDVWHSTTRYGIDISVAAALPISSLFSSADFTSKLDPSFAGVKYLHTIYVGDQSPGTQFAAPVAGGVTLNAINIFTFGCVEPVLISRLSSSLATGQTVCDTVNSIVPVNLTWELENIGNAGLVYVLDTVNVSPPGFVSFSGFSGTILDGINNKDTVTLTFDISTLSPGQTGLVDIIIDGDFSSAPTDTFSFKYVYIPTNNTQPGSNVTVPLTNPNATITFTTVTGEGNTTGSVSGTGPTPPTTFTIIP
ncbi:MAG: hypothetical protein IIB00_08955, partial [candidate division Zixibacteria bacterium]|nr:hypothetical protein [candidate division Zixibacteria bacterium]